jgi:hypothetical protein
MSLGGTATKTAPTGWAYLKSDCTIRWQRSDREAYMLRGNQVGKWTTDGVLGKIPVPHTDWSDLEEIKLPGKSWVRMKKRCPTCGGIGDHPPIP